MPAQITRLHQYEICQDRILYLKTDNFSLTGILQPELPSVLYNKYSKSFSGNLFITHSGIDGSCKCSQDFDNLSMLLDNHRVKIGSHEKSRGMDLSEIGWASSLTVSGINVSSRQPISTQSRFTILYRLHIILYNT